jgi:hypothetical protein
MKNLVCIATSAAFFAMLVCVTVRKLQADGGVFPACSGCTTACEQKLAQFGCTVLPPGEEPCQPAFGNCAVDCICILASNQARCNCELIP